LLAKEDHVRPSLLLRIAAVMALVYALGHTSGAPWTPGEGAEAAGVVEAMKSHPFDVMGSSRTYSDFYIGFGVTISILMFALAVVLWFLGALAKTDAHRIRPLVATLVIAYGVNAFLAWKYFFVVPLVFAVAITVTLAWALAAAGPGRDASSP
jgi:hypothetical protein